MYVNLSVFQPCVFLQDPFCEPEGTCVPATQFPSEEEVSIELDISPEALAAKNEKVGWLFCTRLLFVRRGLIAHTLGCLC